MKKFLKLADGSFRRLMEEGSEDYVCWSLFFGNHRVPKADATPTDEPIRILRRVLGSSLALLSPSRVEALEVAGDLAITVKEIIEHAYEGAKNI